MASLSWALLNSPGSQVLSGWLVVYLGDDLRARAREGEKSDGCIKCGHCCGQWVLPASEDP